MCSLAQVELCVYCLVAGDELTLSVLRDLTLQVNLFSGNVIYWLLQFTRKYNGLLINGHKSRCGRSGVWMLDNSSLGNSVHMNSSWITIQFNSLTFAISSESVIVSTLADTGGATGTPLPTGSNAFVFAHVFAKKHPCRRSAPALTARRPPNGKSWIRHWSK